jgi:hypothetical protein
MNRIDAIQFIVRVIREGGNASSICSSGAMHNDAERLATEYNITALEVLVALRPW